VRKLSKKRDLVSVVLLSLCVSLLFQCGPKLSGVEKIFEDGVEKDFRPVEIPEEFKTLVRKVLGRSQRGQELIKKLYYPPHMPAFRYLFTDDQGRLFVMTNEREGEREYWYDIFSQEGVFIGRTKLDNIQINYVEGKRYTTSTKPIKVKDDHLFVSEKKTAAIWNLKYIA